MNATMGRRVEIVYQDKRWKELGLKNLARPAALAVLDELGLGRHPISVLACDDTRIAVLNGQFRGKPRATDVLSWPAADLAALAGGGLPDRPQKGAPLGDIALAWETCTMEATGQGKRLADHVSHLMVHAVLHLLGYDHLRPEDAALMEGLEVRILAGMGVSDPYQ